MRHQYHYTENRVARRHMYDAEERRKKAAKVIAVLEDRFGDIGDLRLLDVSSSTGHMAAEFARHAREVVGIDLDEEAVAFASSAHDAANLSFRHQNALQTDFPDGSFDVVVCNQMYEHVPDARQLLDEIYRLLAPGGVCYFGATNRLKVIETHYGRLPFLSYLPKPLAHLYLRLLRRSSFYYETHYTFWGLKSLCTRFERIDYTERIVRAPERFSAADMIRPGSLQQRAALAVLACAYWLFPGYVWLLQKPPSAPRG